MKTIVEKMLCECETFCPSQISDDTIVARIIFDRKEVCDLLFMLGENVQNVEDWTLNMKQLQAEVSCVVHCHDFWSFNIQVVRPIGAV